MKFTILLTGGASGGHVFPLIAIGRELAKLGEAKEMKIDLVAITDSRRWKKEFEKAGIKAYAVLGWKVRRYISLNSIFDIFKLPIALLQSLWQVFWVMPNLVVSKGGAAAFFPSLAAKLYFIPLFTHESDTVPGRANRILIKFSNAVFTSFRSTEKHIKSEVINYVGNPVRESVLHGDRKKAESDFKLSSGRPVIFVLGGSHGAKKINRAILDALIILLQKYQIIHQVGRYDYANVQKSLKLLSGKNSKSSRFAQMINTSYRPLAFLNESQMQSAYALADIVISRAGSGDLFEIAANKKPAIIIPLEASANNHQFYNAREMKACGVVIMNEANLTPHLLLNQLENMMKKETNRQLQTQMGLCAKPKAAHIIAQGILDYLNRKT